LKEISFALVAGVTALFLQTTFLGLFFPFAHKPDLVLVLVVWVSLRMTLVSGMTFTFIAGILMDTLSGSPTGLFALVYCIVFVSCNYLNATFEIDGLWGRAIAVCIASLFGAVVVLLTRWSGGPVGFGFDVVRWVLLKSIITGLASMVMIPLMDRFWGGYSRVVGLR